MVELRLLAQGRLAEAYGESRLDSDRFMRAVDLRKAAQVAYGNASPRMKAFFEVYAGGQRLSLSRWRTGPAGWPRLPRRILEGRRQRPALRTAQLRPGGGPAQGNRGAGPGHQVGPERLAWLLPTYRTKPLPDEETAKLRG